MRFDPRKNSDEGVSQIIGVILLIVVSVILTSVVLSFSLGLTEYLRKPPQAGVTINQHYEQTGPNSGEYSITIVVSSLPNADSVEVQGPLVSKKLTKVGDYTTLGGLKKGDIVIVTAKKGDQEVVVRKFRVG